MNRLMQMAKYAIFASIILCLNFAQTQPNLVYPANDATNIPKNVLLQWNEVQGVSTYQVQVSTSPGFGWCLINSSNISNTEFRTSGLYAYTPFYWRVGYLDNGQTVWSESRIFTTNSTIEPEVVLESPDLTFPADNATETANDINFQWSSIEGVTYRLQISTTTNFSVLNNDYSGLTSTNKNVTGLPLYTTMYWRVGCEKDGNTAFSEYRTFTTSGDGNSGSGDTTTLIAPINNALEIPNNTVFKWNADAGKIYKIEVSTSPLFTYSQINVDNINVGEYQSSGLFLATEYYWRVSYEENGIRNYSKKWKFKTSLTPGGGGNPIPSIPTLLTPSINETIEVDSVLLRWNSATNAVSYQVQISEDSLFTSTVVNENNLSETEYLYASLNNQYEYFWRIKAINSTGESNWSETRKFICILPSHTPYLELLAPEDSILTSRRSIELVGKSNSYLFDDVTLKINNEIINAVDSAFNYSFGLSNGVNYINVICFNNQGDSLKIIRTIFADFQSPEVIFTSPINHSETDSAFVAVKGMVTDQNGTSVKINEKLIDIFENEFSTLVLLKEGINLISVESSDTLDNVGLDTIIVYMKQAPVPVDPKTIAPELPKDRPISVKERLSFLYEGPEAIQKEVTAGEIKEERISLLTGKILSKELVPIKGVKVEILDHQEFGYTHTRIDGEYDYVINGGGYYNIKFSKNGYYPIFRQVYVDWNHTNKLDSLVLLELDPKVTEIELGQEAQFVEGSNESDLDGERRADLVFGSGTAAEIVLKDGTKIQKEKLNIRIKEYTSGSTGGAAMPAELPADVTYTYCVELTADEAIQAGAETVKFSKPVAMYVNNFLDFPIGTPVPLGNYDKKKGEWVAYDNGITFKILSISDGIASIDLDGDDMPENIDQLKASNIDSVELGLIGSKYNEGESYWRVEIPHFSTWDCNMGFGPPEGARGPNQNFAGANNKYNQNQNTNCGSIIGIQNQTLGEAINIPGTEFNLTYNSVRTSGYKNYEINIPVIGDKIPSKLLEITVSVTVASKTYTKKYGTNPGQERIRPNLVWEFVWDNKDKYGRYIVGDIDVNVKISYTYIPVMKKVTRFGYNGGAAISVGRTDGNLKLSFGQEWNDMFSNYDVTNLGIRGYSVDANHFYFKKSKSLVKGNGDVSVTTGLGYDKTIVAGTGEFYLTHTGDGGSALDAGIGKPNDIAFLPDGSYLISDILHNLIRKISPDGVIYTIAGLGTSLEENIPANDAQLFQPVSICTGKDGSIYFADRMKNRIRKIDSDGIISTIAGDGNTGYEGDGGLAINAKLNKPNRVAIHPDGSIIIADGYNKVLRRIGTDGIITTIAGGGGNYSEDCPATSAWLGTITDLKVNKDGEIFFSEHYISWNARIHRIRKITNDGNLFTITGNGSKRISVMGDTAKVTELGLSMASSFEFDNNGNLFIVDNLDDLIIRIDQDSTARYHCDNKIFEDENPTSNDLTTIKKSPNGKLYITKPSNSRVALLEQSSMQKNDDNLLIASSDGLTLYEFTPDGYHLKTIDSYTNKDIYKFSYNDDKNLTRIIDANGNVTQFIYNGNKKLVKIISPKGIETNFVPGDDDNLFQIIKPGDEVYEFDYYSDNLLKSMKNPRGFSSLFYYDDRGKLIKDEDAKGGYKKLERNNFLRGNEITVSSAEGNIQKYKTYTPGGDLTVKENTDPSGLKTIKKVYANGVTETEYPNGVKYSYETVVHPRFGSRSPLLKEMKISTPNGLTLTANYNKTITKMDGPVVLGEMDEIIINGKKTVKEYDGEFRNIKLTTPENRITISEIDTLGRVLKTTVSGIIPTEYIYDSEGRINIVKQGERTTSYGFNLKGELETIIDPAGRVEAYYYNEAGRLSRQVLPNGKEIFYSYDKNGNLKSITPPGREAHIFNYTEVDMNSEYLPPLTSDTTGGIQYFYNKDKQITNILKPDGNSIIFEYDSTGCGCAGVGNPKLVRFNNGLIEYTYDSETGNLNSVNSADSVLLLFDYDGTLPTNSTIAGRVQGSIEVTYNNDFRINSQTINGGNTISIGYDNDGLLSSAGLMSITRDESNGLINSKSIGDLINSYNYNGFGEVSNNTYSFNGSTIYNTSFERDTLGRITSSIETVEGVTKEKEFIYNSIGYLVEVKTDGQTNSKYTYDDNGNRIVSIFVNLQDSVVTSDTLYGSFDQQDRMLSYGNVNYYYTKSGNLSAKVNGVDTTRYNYDGLGNLKTVWLPDGNKIDYIVDGQNRRSGKYFNGKFIEGYLYQDQLNPTAVVDSTGNVTARFVYGAKPNVPEYMIKGDSTYAFVTDHLGSVRLLVNLTSGKVVQNISYDEFGNVISNIGQDLTIFYFAGGLYEQVTGLTRFGARDYDASIGRWTAKDPILFEGGLSNLYEYCNNDPINYYDLEGKQSLWESIKGIFISEKKNEIVEITDPNEIAKYFKHINDINKKTDESYFQRRKREQLNSSNVILNYNGKEINMTIFSNARDQAMGLDSCKWFEDSRLIFYSKSPAKDSVQFFIKYK